MRLPRDRALRRCGLAASALTLGLTAGGCGKSARIGSLPAHASRSTPRRAVPRGPGVPASAAAVIEGWSDALRSGQRRRAAAYWARPSAMINGVDANGRLALVEIDSEHDALLADDSLSCGATLRRTARRGPYIEADFALSVRSGPGASSSGCSGPARVEFLIRGGRIARWLRAPSTGLPSAPAAPAARGSQSV